MNDTAYNVNLNPNRSYDLLSHLPRDKMAAISQMIVADEFLLTKMFVL